MFPVNMVLCGDSKDLLGKLDHECVDLTVTSPPYDALRDYNGYSFDFPAIARELYRVTKAGGVVVWVVGDATVQKSETGTSFRQALYFKELGFNLHDTMIYEKANFSNPSKTRYHQIFEYMFVLSKGQPKTFNPIKDKPNKWAGKSCFGKNTFREKDGSMSERDKNVYDVFGMRTNVWRMNTASQETPCKSFRHPAVFPKRLAQDHILSWSNEGDVVLDPFAGSGTTLVAAKQLKRNYIGMEISPEYIALINQGLGV